MQKDAVFPISGTIVLVYDFSKATKHQDRHLQDHSAQNSVPFEGRKPQEDDVTLDSEPRKGDETVLKD